MKAFRFTLFSLSIITLLCSSSCDTSEELVEGSVEPPRHLEIEQINQAVLTGNGDEPVGSEKGYVIQTQTEWEDLREKMNAVNDTQGQVSIDFEESTVLAYFDKIRPNGGYSIEIVQVIESDEMIKAVYRSTAPGGVATTIMTQPFHIVNIPKTEKAVKFLPITE
ncbi:MAG: protease complex subunit PrcB family protein [Crocinitomicaceae bacterium]